MNLFVLDAKVSHRNRRTRMIKPLTDYLKADTIFCPLHISPGFSQRVSAVVAVKVDRPCPFFYHIVCRLDGDRLISLRGSYSNGTKNDYLYFK